MGYDSEEDFIISESGEIYLSEGESFVFGTLVKDSFATYNRKIMLIWGLEASIFLCSIISKYKYFKERNKLSKDGYFFNTSQNIYLDTGLKRRGQNKAIKILKSLKILTTKKQGVPPKLWFKIDCDALKSQFVQSYKLICTNVHYINKNKDNNNKSSLKQLKKICVSDETPPGKKVLTSGKGKRLTEKQKEEISAKMQLHPFATKALAIWNTLPNVTHHKKPSKTWLNVIKSLNMLKFGKLYTRNFNKDFLKKYNISEDTLKFKFSKQEIIITLKKVSEWCKQGFLKRDKNFRTSLPDAIYSPRSEFFQSVFLIARSNDLTPAVQKIENKFPEITDYFQKKTQIKLNDNILNQLCKNLNGFYIYHKTYILKKSMNYSTGKLFGDFKSMCITFINWLVDNDKNRNTDKDFKYSVVGFKSDSIMFKKFIKHYEKTLNVNFSPSLSRF